MLIIGLCGKAGSGKDTVADFLVRDHGFVKLAFADPIKRICQEIFDFTNDQLWGPSEKRNEPDYRYVHRKAGENGWTDVRMFIPAEYLEKRQCPPGTFDGCAFKGLEHLVTWCGSEDNYGFLPDPPEDEYLTPRYALQRLGTEWGRDCYSDIWAEYGLRVAKRLLAKDSPAHYDQRFGIRSCRMSDRKDLKGVVISDVRFMNEVQILKKHGAKVVRIYRPLQKSIEGSYSQHQSEVEQDSIPDDLFDFILNNNGSLDDLAAGTRSFLMNFQSANRTDGFVGPLNGTDESITMSGPIDVSSVADKHLRGLVEQRQCDVEEGKILSYYEDQKDIPPFLRMKT